MPWRYRYRLEVHLTQIRATTKVSGMSTSEQGVKNRRKARKQVIFKGLLLGQLLEIMVLCHFRPLLDTTQSYD